MELPRPPRRTMRENIIPMINVVFLLLIFFLMTAQITPPEPFEVTPPESLSDDLADGQVALHMNADGELALGEARGDQVLVALTQLGPDDVVLIRADRTVSAVKVANLLGRLSGLELGGIKLVAEER